MAGKRNVKFLRAGLTKNGRVFMNGEVVPYDLVFVGDDKPISQEEQLESYHTVFYTLTEEEPTDPLRYVPPTQPVEIVLRPQPAGREDGMGKSEIGSPHSPGPRSATATVSVPKGMVATSAMPDVEITGKNHKKTQPSSDDDSGTEEAPLRLERRIGKHAHKPEDAKKRKKGPLLVAEPTKLSRRRSA